MCCEECPRYERCYEDDSLKEDCCRRCPEYKNCNGYSEEKRRKTGRTFLDPENDGEDLI